MDTTGPHVNQIQFHARDAKKDLTILEKFNLVGKSKILINFVWFLIMAAKLSAHKAYLIPVEVGQDELELISYRGRRLALTDSRIGNGGDPYKEILGFVYGSIARKNEHCTFDVVTVSPQEQDLVRKHIFDAGGYENIVFLHDKNGGTSMRQILEKSREAIHSLGPVS